MEILIGHYHDADIAKIIAIVIHIMAANPRPKSFRDIVLYHRDSLINLLQWTSYHINLVGCRFDMSELPLSVQNLLKTTTGTMMVESLTGSHQTMLK